MTGEVSFGLGRWSVRLRTWSFRHATTTKARHAIRLPHISEGKGHTLQKLGKTEYSILYTEGKKGNSRHLLIVEAKGYALSELSQKRVRARSHPVFDHCRWPAKHSRKYMKTRWMVGSGHESSSYAQKCNLESIWRSKCAPPKAKSRIPLSSTFYGAVPLFVYE